MADDNEAQYAPPASQVDLEARRESENRSSRVVTTSKQYVPPVDDGDGRDFRVEGQDTSNYVATDPIYQTYANDTEAPLRGEDSVEEDVVDEFLTQMEPHGVEDGADQLEDESSSDSSSSQTSPSLFTSSSPTPPSSGSTPPSTSSSSSSSSSGSSS